MSRPDYIIPEEYEVTTQDMEEYFKSKGVWVKYTLFPKAHLAEMKMADKNSYEAAMELLDEMDITRVSSIFGIENERMLLIQFPQI